MTQKKIVTAFDLEFDDANLQKFYGQTMMSIKDLMFGDWVDAEGYGRVKGIIIDEEDYCPQVLIRDDVWYPLNLIEPIPLTPEILEKNGFTKGKGGNFVYDNEDENIFMIFYPKKMNYNGIYDFIDISIGCIDIKELPIQYVHELQHALALCGFDKEIIL